MPSPISERNWNSLTFPTIHRIDDIRSLRQWLKDNLRGRFKLIPIHETWEINGRRRTRTVCAFARIEEEADLIMIKMIYGTSVI